MNTPPPPPLTHHEIVRLVEPLVRAGHAVDLAASDRTARRIRCRAVSVVIAATPGVAWQGTLELEARRERFFVLRRRLRHPDGPDAEIEASGDDIALLLQRIEAVPPSQQVSAGAGWLVVRSYDADPPQSARRAAAADPSALVLTHATVHTAGLALRLRLKLPGLRSVAADLELQPQSDAALDLPEDLLAVLGWDWARLVRQKEGWISKLRLRGAILRRSRTAEGALDRAGAHLARVLADSPASFHDRHRWARWGATLRRGIPTLMVIGMIVGALMLPRLIDPERLGMWMALHYLPIALLALAFSLQELSRFEIPPLPRRSTAPSWRRAAEPQRQPA